MTVTEDLEEAAVAATVVDNPSKPPFTAINRRFCCCALATSTPSLGMGYDDFTLTAYLGRLPRRAFSPPRNDAYSLVFSPKPLSRIRDSSPKTGE